jgi:protein-tyrosine-phosphatase
MAPSEPLKANARSLKTRLLALLPRTVSEHLRELRGLSAPERHAHIRATARRLWNAPAPVPPNLRADGSILFVCYGNIIRSALAEALLRHEFERLGTERRARIDSAGVAAKPGREADARAVAAAAALGVDLSHHRARRVSNELIAGADIIYVMDRLNEAQLTAAFPAAQPKVRRLGALAPRANSDIIADPYTSDADAVASAAKRIAEATASLAAELVRRSSSAPRRA